jgi:hypothetical protein
LPGKKDARLHISWSLKKNLLICLFSVGEIISMNDKEEDGTPFIVAVAELLARFKP